MDTLTIILISITALVVLYLATQYCNSEYENFAVKKKKKPAAKKDDTNNSDAKTTNATATTKTVDATAAAASSVAASIAAAQDSIVASELQSIKDAVDTITKKNDELQKAQADVIALIQSQAATLAQIATKATYASTAAAQASSRAGALAGNGVYDKLQLGNKFRLSGVGDGYANDEWLRLNDLNNGYGNTSFAAGKLYADNELTVKGDILANKICSKKTPQLCMSVADATLAANRMRANNWQTE